MTEHGERSPANEPCSVLFWDLPCLQRARLQLFWRLAPSVSGRWRQSSGAWLFASRTHSQLPRSARSRFLGTYCVRSAIQISYASSSFSIILNDISLPCFSTGSHFGFSFQSRFWQFFLGQFFYGPRFKKHCECGGKNPGCESPGFFFGCWAVFPLIFFSFSKSKLPGYILPAIPPLALLCSISVLRSLENSPIKRRSLLAGIGISWLLIGFAAAHAIGRIDSGLAGLSHFFAGAAMVVGLFLIAASFYRTGQWVIPLCILFVAGSLETANLRLLPALDRFYSGRPHAEFLRNDLRPDRIFTYQLSRSWDYGLAFYFRRQLPEWSPTDPDAAFVLTTPAGLRDITRLDRFRGSLNENYKGILYVPVVRVASPR